MRAVITACGDALLIKRFPNDYDIEPIRKFIEQGEARCVNLETVLVEDNCYASPFCGGQWICSKPNVAEDLKRLGFNLVGCANNHSMDISHNGLMSTCDILKRNKLVFAGIGGSLTEAARPAYLKRVDDNGRDKIFALVDFTATFIDAARAGDGNRYFPARPGVNGVRHKEVFYINSEEMQILKQIAKNTFINGERDNARKIGSLPPEEPDTFNFGGIFFKESERAGKSTTTDGADEKRVLDAIKEARENADFVVVMGHAHQIKHDSYTEPDYFCEDLYRKCIDAGADVVFGGGTHRLQPIEIYKNRPIFYSLGNFIFHNDLVERLPDDFWDKYGYDRKWSISECLAVKSKRRTIGLETDRNNYYSVIPCVEFQNKVLQSIKLKPLELHFTDTYKGFPGEANEQDSEFLFQYLQEVSKPYHTEFRRRHGIIEVIV